MNRNLKLALAALLGFSAACTSVKNAPKEDTAKTQGADTTAVKGYPEFPRRVVVMYGRADAPAGQRPQRAAQTPGTRTSRFAASRGRTSAGGGPFRRQKISHVTPPAGASQTTGPQYFFRTLCFDGARTPSRYAILGVHAALQPLVPPLRQRLRVDPGVADMPLADFLKVLDEEVTPHVDPADVLVIFSGGEVLVRADLEEAGAEVTRRGYPWGMVTNGMALTPERFGRLLDAGLKSVSVSLDGFEREHNYIRGNPRSYDRALEAVRMIVREPSLSYDVVTCVTGAMVPQLEAFRDMLLSEGVRHWRLFSIFPMGRAKNDPTLRMTDAQFREMLEFIRRTRQEGRIEVSYACEGFLGGYEAEVRDHFYQCAAGVSVASIRVDGAISGCTSIRANYHQGNIYRDRFWDVWQNRFEPFRDREWARRGECADCSMFRYCQGGGMHLRGDDGELLYCHYHRL